MKRRGNFLTVLAAVLLLSVTDAEACSRVVHQFKNGTVLTGRSMDWFVRYPTSLWKFPRGVEREGLTPRNPARWTSRYGSVVVVQTAAGTQSATADGINEKGLAANLMYLTETKYPKRNPKVPGVASSVYLQYLLDNFATVAEAVKFLNKEAVQIVPVPIPESEHLPTMHIALSDATGDSAIVEFLDGKTVIHHSRKYRVMTNSPIYEKQLTLTDYWRAIGGHSFLPGTRNSPDRFVRASFYNEGLPETNSTREAIAEVMSVIRNVSSPFGHPDPRKPNISTTLWRVVADHTHGRYYYESTLSPNVIWVDLKKFDFAPGSGTKVLHLGEESDFCGEVNAHFEASKPLEFARVPEVKP